MLEHSYEYTTTQEPTLLDYGLEIGVCGVCGVTEERQIMYLGANRSSPGVVTVEELIAEIETDIDAAKIKYNEKWIQITGEVVDSYSAAGMTGYFLCGERGGSSLRIICWVDGDSPFGLSLGRGLTLTFVGQVREITIANATEIGDCEIVSD